MSIWLGRFIRFRREQLGLSIDDVRSLAKRKRFSKLQDIEEDRWFLGEGADAAALELVLRLPVGTLDQVRFDPTDPALLIARLEEKIQRHDAEIDVSRPPCCPLCERDWRDAARSYQVEAPARIVQKGEPCLCGSRRAALSGVVALAGALWLAGVRRALVLGGSSDMDRALDSVGTTEIKIVRTTHAGARFDTTVLSRIDLLVLAKGEVGHSATQNVSQALRAMPIDQRPFFLNASSSNISGLAADVFWLGDDIRSHLLNRRTTNATSDRSY